MVVVGEQVGESCVIKNPRGGVAYVEKNLVERALGKIAFNEFAQLVGVAEGSERTVDQADDFAEQNFGGIAPQLIAAFRPADTFHQARVHQFQKDQFQKLLGQSFFISDLPDLDGALPMVAGQHHQSLESVETLLRNLHGSELFHKVHLANRLY